jgi:D-alanyl-D-alanine carboxypeptidase/D-alanyl-D-alanine-endopeptidase (penicillin-binding protein 4)
MKPTNQPIVLLVAAIMALSATLVSLELSAGPAAAQSTLASQLARELALAGSQSGAEVYDLTTSQVLFSERAGVARPPASVEKLYTATTALSLMGPSATMSTTVLGTGHLGIDGRWEGNLYLRGGGDPTFGSTAFVAGHYGEGTTVASLASKLVHEAGIRSVTGTIDGDESYFDSLRGEPASDYRFDPDLEGNLSALAFNRGETGQERGTHAPAAYAARQLRGALRADHVTVHGGSAATTPPGATPLASASSPSLSKLLALTLAPSDNFFAETLLKDIGARYGSAGTTAAGAAVVRSTIAKIGIHPRLYDGSGLSHADLTTPAQIITLLRAIAPSAIGTTERSAMAVAGHTGTLSERMRGTAASGRCHAKTGTLIGVSNLAGYCETESGQVLAFAIFNDDIETIRAHTIQDSMAITLARY